MTLDTNVWIPVGKGYGTRVLYALKVTPLRTFDVAAKVWDPDDDEFKVVRFMNCQCVGNEFMTMSGASIVKELRHTPIAVMVIDLPKLDKNGKMVVPPPVTATAPEPFDVPEPAPQQPLSDTSTQPLYYPPGYTPPSFPDAKVRRQELEDAGLIERDEDPLPLF